MFLAVVFAVAVVVAVLVLVLICKVDMLHKLILTSLLGFWPDFMQLPT